MNQSVKGQSVNLGQQSTGFKLKPVAAGCAVLLFGMMNAALAQQASVAQDQAEPSTIQSVTVVGIRRGIEDAQAAKRNSDMIVEAISAEDLGKLPDDSIADALSTLPGVAAQIIGGRAATLNIRGLSGDFVNVTFNGREQASVGDNRAVMFDQYPAELISAATVYKTPDAALIGQGLAATVDLKTLLPLDFSKQVVQFKAMGERASYGELNPETNATGDRLSASYIDQFADRTIGVAFGMAHLDSPVEDKQRGGLWGVGNNAPVPAYPNANGIEGDQWWSNSTTSTRDGLMGVVEWKPNHDFTSVVDAYYSHSNNTSTNRGIQSGLNYANVTNPVVDASGFLTSGNGAALGGGSAWSKSVQVENNLNTESDHIFSIGWKNTYKADKWTLVADLSGSHASSQQGILETYSGPMAPVTGNFTASPNGGLNFTNSSVNLANPASVVIGDSAGWGQDGYDKYPHVTDGVTEFRLTGNRELDSDLFTSVEFGANLTDRKKTRESTEYLVDFTGKPYSRSNTLAIPASLIVGTIGLPSGAPSSIVGLNIPALMASGIYTLTQKLHGDIYAKDWSVTEKISTMYGQLNIGTTIAGIPVRGNMGLQFIHSNQSSDAISSQGGGDPIPASTSSGASYNNVLPSLNLVGSLVNNQEVRLGLAEELQRPRFDDMNASNEANIGSNLMWSSAAGNPALKPTLADALDISYTKYFGKVGYVSVAPYYKYLKTYIYTEAEPYDFSNVPYTGPAPLSNIGEATQPVNGTGGNLKGVELTVNMPFEILTPALKDFGMTGNVSEGKSKIQTNFNGDVKQSSLPGFSSSVANLILYYAHEGFEIRYRESYRSAYLGEVQGFGANLAYSSFLGVHTDSLQASYEFKEGPIKGLTMLAQVLNLNNPTVSQTLTYNNSASTAINQTDTYGRTYLLGINYKM